MTNATFELPDTRALSRALETILARDGDSRKALRSIKRSANVYSSTFPSEIVTCVFVDGSNARLLCKHQKGSIYEGHGHWGELAYEGIVYTDLLNFSSQSLPKFFGTYYDERVAQTLLAIEYLDDAMRVNKLPVEEGMGAAARWIGQFHTAHERLAVPHELRRYDVSYYRGWAQRTSQFAGALHRQFPWLASVCERFDELIAPLFSAQLTVIHGEYQPHNVLSRNGIIYPVDWQSAAVAAGEIDLVALTDGPWGNDVVDYCVSEYKRARWPQGAPVSFANALSAARLYWPMRWLGDLPELTTDESMLWRFEQLRSAGEQVGAI